MISEKKVVRANRGTHVKIRTLFAGLIATLALALAVPVAAHAETYGGGAFSGTVSDTSPQPGQATTITVEGPANTQVTLTVTGPGTVVIAGTASATKTTSGAGVATFSVTFPGEGVYTLVATETASGQVIFSQRIVVGDGTAGDGLSSTGTDALPIVLGAVALVLVGGAITLVAVRRRRGSASL